VDNLEKAGLIFVETGYCDDMLVEGEPGHENVELIWSDMAATGMIDPTKVEDCNPFADTLEGRKQADALEDWLYNKFVGDKLIWDESASAVITNHSNKRQWRLDRIDWCLSHYEGVI